MKVPVLDFHGFSHVTFLKTEKIFWYSPMTEVEMIFYGLCPDSSPVLRTMTWLKPWKSKNGTFTALDLLNGWDLGHDP